MASAADIRSTAQQVHVEALGRAAAEPAGAQGVVDQAKANLRTLRVVADEETRGLIDGLMVDLDRVLAGDAAAFALPASSAFSRGESVEHDLPHAPLFASGPPAPSPVIPPPAFSGSTPVRAAEFQDPLPLPSARIKSRRGLWIGVGALVVVIVAGAAFAARKDEAGTAAIGAQTTISTSASTTVGTPSAPPSTIASPTPAPTPTPTPAPTPEFTPTPAPTPTPAVAAVMPDEIHQGSGDDIVTLTSPPGPRIVKFDCPKCTSNVAVTTNGRESLIVNEIGAYTGRHLIDIYKTSQTTELEIKASGRWTVTVQDLAASTSVTNSAQGKGDDVVRFTTTGTKAKITYKGKSNFSVHGYGGDYAELAVNEIGSYGGTVRLTTPGLVQVNADPAGTWTIETS